MKYKIKWFWHGAEQSAIVDSNDDAKPLVVIYEFENNICRVDRYTVLWSDQEWDWQSSDMKPAKIVPIHNYELVRGNWYIDTSADNDHDDGYRTLTYRDYAILSWNDYGESISYVKKCEALAEWFLKTQPTIKEWQIYYIVNTNNQFAALDYLKASIEHE